MKKTLTSIVSAIAMIAFASSCDKKVDPQPEPLSDLSVVFAEKTYSVTLGQESTIEFTVEGIGDADVAVNAIPKKSEWTASASIDETGKGILKVTAPEKLALTTIEVEAIDEANSRKATATISVTATAEGLDELGITFAGTPLSIQAGGASLTIDYAVTGLGKAVLEIPDKDDVVSSLSVESVTYDATASSGQITVSCASTVTAESVALKFSITDSYARKCEQSVDIKVIPAPVVEDSYNCYIVKPGAEITFAKKASEVASAVIAWQDATNLIETLTVDGDNVKVKAKAGVEGNALILGKDLEAKTVWSWHIWVTDYDPETDNMTINGVTFMARNLGAVSATPGDAGAIGMTYQWGRRDPLPRMTSIVMTGNAEDVIYDADGNAITTKKNSKFYRFKGTAENISIETTYSIPDYFIERFSDTGTWWRGVDIAVAKNYWGGEDLKKSINDPCPKGWKVPAVTRDSNGDPVNPYAFILTDKAVLDAANSGLSYTDGGKTMWLPCTGERYRTSGLAARNGWEGNYWTASYNKNVDGAETFYYAQFTTDKSKSGNTSFDKALDYGEIRIVQAGSAVAVRCVKE